MIAFPGQLVRPYAVNDQHDLRTMGQLILQRHRRRVDPTGSHYFESSRGVVAHQWKIANGDICVVRFRIEGDSADGFGSGFEPAGTAQTREWLLEQMIAMDIDQAPNIAAWRVRSPDRASVDRVSVIDCQILAFPLDPAWIEDMVRHMINEVAESRIERMDAD